MGLPPPGIRRGFSKKGEEGKVRGKVRVSSDIARHPCKYFKFVVQVWRGARRVSISGFNSLGDVKCMVLDFCGGANGCGP